MEWEVEEVEEAKEKDTERVPPPVFCKRVRNELIWHGLREYSFCKSAQEIETEGVNFWRFLRKSEK